MRCLAVSRSLVVTAALAAATALGIGAPLASSLALAQAEQEPQAGASGTSGRIEPAADQILREMGAYLAAATELRFAADVSYDVVRSGRRVLLGGHADIAVRRPDRLHTRFDGDERRNQVMIDGRSFIFYNALTNTYARMEVPAGLDAALDSVFEATGQAVPIADLMYSDPYRTLIENAEGGSVVGRHIVDGAVCHHLAFSNPAIDWQLWIEDGPQPVPRQLVITYKNLPGVPQFIARLSGWDLRPQISSGYFEFRPPEGSAEIDFLRIDRKEEGQ